MSKADDKRRRLPPLLKASHSSDATVRLEAIEALGRLGHKRAFKRLCEVLTDEVDGIRFTAINALAMLQDQRAIPVLADLAQNPLVDIYERKFAVYALGFYSEPEAASILHLILQNKNEPVPVRADAAEQLAIISVHTDHPKLMPLYLEALQENDAEMRFWAAYGIVIMTEWKDLAYDFHVLDQVVAYDDAAPPHWWQVGRELAPTFEMLWHRQLNHYPIEDGDSFNVYCYLISPALEYGDYRQAASSVEPPVLSIDPLWLADQLQAHWPQIQFNVRQPRPASYLLDWLLPATKSPLTGGLHRDGYGLFITGQNEQAIAEFTVWYRSIIAPEHVLRFYEWADTGIEITSNITPQELFKGRFRDT